MFQELFSKLKNTKHTKVFGKKAVTTEAKLSTRGEQAWIKTLGVYYKEKYDKNNPYWRRTELVPTDELWKYKEYDRTNSEQKESGRSIDEAEEYVVENGIDDPCILIYGQKDCRVILGEGNYRLTVARRLGIPAVPCRVVRQLKTYKHSEISNEPIEVEGYSDQSETGGYVHVPGVLKPSDIGIEVMSEAVIEANRRRVMAKQSSITKLFPKFYDRVAGVKGKGGIIGEPDFHPGEWTFEVSSGTEDDLSYVVNLKFVNLVPLLKAYGSKKRFWEGDEPNYAALSSNILNKVDIKVYCGCPAFLYWGKAYILSLPRFRAKYGRPEKRPPDIRNPKQYGAVCKHLHVVLSELTDMGEKFADYLKDYYGPALMKLKPKPKVKKKKKIVKPKKKVPGRRVGMRPRAVKKEEPVPKRRVAMPFAGPVRPKVPKKVSALPGEEVKKLAKTRRLRRERKVSEVTTADAIVIVPSHLGQRVRKKKKVRRKK